ncbi:MAG: 50S ribosomal protein L25/general stress protein Ctc [Thiotrichales bacterium]
MSDYTLTAEKRSEQGKGASRRLRHAGKLPGIIYGGGKEPMAITLTHAEVVRKLEDEGFYTQVIDLMVDGKAQKVILRDLQRHPAKPFTIHMDFQRILADEALRVTTPLHFINEETCAGVKAGGVLVRQMVDTEIEALPADIPGFIEVDVAELGIGDSIHLDELKVPAGVTLLDLPEDHGDEDGESSMPTVATVEAPKVEAAEEGESAEGETEAGEE